MDGKHIALTAPKNTGSEFFNYKGFFSIVLFGIMDAKYRFIYFNVGSQGRISDGGVFENTLFKKLLQKSQLNLPDENPLPGCSQPVPFVFLGDDAFPLLHNLLKPHPGAQTKGSPKRVFNYRLSRARRVSENVFGILSAKFRVLRKAMTLEPETAEIVVSASIYLHNFLRNSSTSKMSYTPPGTFDSEDKDTGEMIQGSWRREQEDSHLISFKKVARKPTNEAKNVRDQFTAYFSTPRGMVPWQNKY